MILTLALLISSLNLNAQSCGSANLDWTVCKKKEDCVVIKDMCGSPISVNHKYEKVAQDFQSCRGAVVDCAGPKNVNMNPKTQCQSNRCIVIK